MVECFPREQQGLSHEEWIRKPSHIFGKSNVCFHSKYARSQTNIAQYTDIALRLHLPIYRSSPVSGRMKFDSRVFKGAAKQFVPSRRIPYTAQGKFCAPVRPAV
jgi:hypothetical protein